MTQFSISKRVGRVNYASLILWNVLFNQKSLQRNNISGEVAVNTHSYDRKENIQVVTKGKRTSLPLCVLSAFCTYSYIIWVEWCVYTETPIHFDMTFLKTSFPCAGQSLRLLTGRAEEIPDLLSIFSNSLVQTVVGNSQSVGEQNGMLDGQGNLWSPSPGV